MIALFGDINADIILDVVHCHHEIFRLVSAGRVSSI